MTPTLIKYAIIIGTAFLTGSGIGFGSAWKWQEVRLVKQELKTSEVKLEVANADTTRAQESFRQLELDSQQKSTAAANKVGRDVVIRADAGRAADAGNGLRLASADTARSAQESAAACFASVAIYDQLLGTVVEAGGRMAAEADQWESDAVMRHEAAK